MAEPQIPGGVAILNSAVIVQLLEEILAELRHLNTTERTGAVSSVQIEDLVGKQPKVVTKRYTGSDPEVEEAIADHALAKQLANDAYMRDWEVTVAALRGSRA